MPPAAADATKPRPDWDMSSYFSALNAPDYKEFLSTLSSDVEALRATRSVTADHLVAVEQASARFEHLSSYLSCLGAAEAGDEEIQQQTAALAPLQAELEKLFVALRAAFKVMTDDDFEQLLGDERLAPVRYFYGRVRQEAQLTMASELEELAADLGVTGLSAWGRLYDQLSGKLTFQLEVPGAPARSLPVAMARSLLEDADPAVRKAALVGSNAAWEGVGDTVAACFNAISGTRLALYQRRGIEHFLAPALFDAGIERTTLDAMLEAVRGRQQIGRSYLKHKAGQLGVARLGFQDTMAPLPGDHSERVSWEQAVSRIRDSFGGFYPALCEFADRAFGKRWIDYTPRDGKRPGGFCTGSSVISESRIFMTYNGAAGDVQTLAHELGHAFHSWLMRDMRPFAQHYPMTLAETASTFAEQIVIEAMLQDPATSPGQHRALLDHRLMEGATFLLNIPTRFDFEFAAYQRRSQGELSVSELKQLMVDAIARNYGDALDPDQLDPWFWASKLHFYITDVSFYNFPYTFGYLFSMGLFARAKAEGTSFLATYEELLRRTGSDTAEGVARSVLGIDLGTPQFWNESIDLIEADLTRYIGS